MTIEEIFRAKNDLVAETYSLAVLGSVGKTSLLHMLQQLIRRAGFSIEKRKACECPQPP